MCRNYGAGQSKDKQLLAVNAVDQRTPPNKQQSNPMGPWANNHNESRVRVMKGQSH
jgi:hypothetical protein